MTTRRLRHHGYISQSGRVPCGISWSDIGSWNVIGDLTQGNISVSAVRSNLTAVACKRTTTAASIGLWVGAAKVTNCDRDIILYRGMLRGERSA